MEKTYSGITIDGIVDGRIVESWADWGMMGMMQQLGVVPTLGHSEETSPT